MTVNSNSKRAEYFKARYAALKNRTKQKCAYCKKPFTEKKKLGRCSGCKDKFVKTIKEKYVNEGKSFDEIGREIESERNFSGERVRQIYEETVPGGFIYEEIECHKNNRTKRRIEEKTGKKVEELVRIVSKSKTIFTPKKISREFDCSWEYGKATAEYLLQWYPGKVEGKLISMTKDDYIDFVKIDLEEHSF